MHVLLALSSDNKSASKQAVRTWFNFFPLCFETFFPLQAGYIPIGTHTGRWLSKVNKKKSKWCYRKSWLTFSKGNWGKHKQKLLWEVTKVNLTQANNRRTSFGIYNVLCVAFCCTNAHIISWTKRSLLQ